MAAADWNGSNSGFDLGSCGGKVLGGLRSAADWVWWRHDDSWASVEVVLPCGGVFSSGHLECCAGDL